MKRFIRFLLPDAFFYRYEHLFRILLYQFYRGNRYQCNICKRKLRKFMPLGDENLLCPACGSNSRNRRLWSLLNDEFLQDSIIVLHFSPSRSLYRSLKSITSFEYNSSDFAGEFLAEKKLDMTDTKEKSDWYDLIICYHVLEHIEDDLLAMKELYRILKPGGYCLIQTPFKEGNIYEDATIDTGDMRLKHFGQADHVRIYSVSGLTERLTDAGFYVDIRKFQEDSNNFYGFKMNEVVLIARK